MSPFQKMKMHAIVKDPEYDDYASICGDCGAPLVSTHIKDITYARHYANCSNCKTFHSEVTMNRVVIEGGLPRGVKRTIELEPSVFWKPIRISP